MCNGLPFVPPQGIHSYDAVDADAAEEIARLVAEVSGGVICPHIRECFRDCLVINNKHPHAYPDVPAVENPDGVDGSICSVVAACSHDCTAFADVSIPRNLLH